MSPLVLFSSKKTPDVRNFPAKTTGTKNARLKQLTSEKGVLRQSSGPQAMGEAHHRDIETIGRSSELDTNNLRQIIVRRHVHFLGNRA
jgi:hypothetical protein